MNLKQNNTTTKLLKTNKMKNIHILPTDKPSRLHLGNSGLVLCDLIFNSTTINAQHIYITSDEEIKDDEWHLHFYEGQPVISKSHNGASEYINLKAKEFGYKKIILTTDQDLIADGIEQISEDVLLKIVEHINSGKNIESFDEL